MTPTKLTASTVSIEEMSLRRFVRRARRRFARRELIALPAVLALMLPATALATETAGYNTKPPTPTTTKTEAKKAVEPSSTTKTTTTPTPQTTVEPTTPATTTAPAAKASTLPFTGLDLRWVVGAGLLLLVAGFSIRLAVRGRPGTGR
jgi:uncharacterized membrane protein